jgi:3'-phosphoadenosine 5'-phosphosulfate sulfotransferase (PAPS reductase)/FAD synthetase
VRGCDTAPKLDASKALVRCYRAAILRAHCGDPKKAATFIEAVDSEELYRRMDAFRKDCDHYPLHYVTHLLHAAQIVGYKGPKDDPVVLAMTWGRFYARMCKSLHVNVETEVEMDMRLNAGEEAFARQDRI